MHVFTELTLMVGVIAVAVPMATTYESPSLPPEPDAMARFINNTPSPATLRANGEALFRDVSAGQVTEYAQVRDSSITFSLDIRDRPGDSVSVTQKLEDGVRYTLTARVDLEGQPVLNVVREEQPVAMRHAEW